MRSSRITYALGIAGLTLALGACSDPASVSDRNGAPEPLYVLDVLVRNGTAGDIDVALETDRATVPLGSIPRYRETRYQVEARALTEGDFARLVATDAELRILRSDPVWVAAGWTLDFSVTPAGIAAKSSSLDDSRR